MILADQIAADSGLDLVAYAIAGLPATVGAIAALFIAVRSLKHNSEIRDQVSNDHPTNLRDDLDRTDDKVDQVDTKVDLLTGTVASLVHALDAFMAESRATAARQDRIAAKHHPEDMR